MEIEEDDLLIICGDIDNAVADELGNLQTDDNLGRLSLVSGSVESLQQSLEAFGDDQEFCEYFELDKFDLAKFNTKLDEANEGLLESFIRGTIPFIDIYLDSTNRLIRQMATDRISLQKLRDIRDYRFALIKAAHLDIYEHFIDKLAALTALNHYLLHDTADLKKLDIARLNRILQAIGLEVSKQVFAVSKQGMAKAAAIATGVATTVGAIETPHRWMFHIWGFRLSESSVVMRILNSSPILKIVTFIKESAKALTDIVLMQKLNTTRLSILSKLVSIKALAVGFSVGQLVSGGASVLFDMTARALSLPVHLKGWTKQGVIPAFEQLQTLLANNHQLDVFQKQLKTSFHDAYMAAKAERKFDEMVQLKENYKLLTKLASLYVKNAVMMVHGMHELCEGIEYIAKTELRKTRSSGIVSKVVKTGTNVVLNQY